MLVIFVMLTLSDKGDMFVWLAGLLPVIVSRAAPGLVLAKPFGSCWLTMDVVVVVVACEGKIPTGTGLLGDCCCCCCCRCASCSCFFALAIARCELVLLAMRLLLVPALFIRC